MIALGLGLGLALGGASWVSGPALAEVITRIPTTEPVIALTFDACEAGKPTVLDRGIVDFLAAERIPYTLFVSGRFARRHKAALAKVLAGGLVEIENHSFNHPLHMERLTPERVTQEVLSTAELLFEITGQRPRFFRFPGGYYDARTLAQVEGLGYQVVHWGIPSGDPSPDASALQLTRRVLAHSHNGSIHIFHVNGRGWHTAEALPQIIAGLRGRGFRFVRLDEVL